MVSVKHFEGDYPLSKQTSGSEQSEFSQVTSNGSLHASTVPVFHFGTKSAQNNGFSVELPCTSDKGQSLLDLFFLSQWEDCACRGLLRYDVTSCETKVICGGKEFVAQLNENWNLNIMEFDYDILQPPEGFIFSCMRTSKENLLFCVASGDKDSSELIHSATLPNNAILIIINAKPVEYGHVFLVPYSCHHPQIFLDKRSLEPIIQVAGEINNSSFRVSFDHKSSSDYLNIFFQVTGEINNSSFRVSFDHKSSSDYLNIFFQACYFADTLPVERRPVISLFNELIEKGLNICEVVDYPMKALVFMGKRDLRVLEVVSEMCSCLQDLNTPFNLLISDCGAKIFLFPQVCTPRAGANLSAWECGGHFVFTASPDFELAMEEDILKRMAAVSLDDKGFGTIKHLCSSIARKIFT